MLFSLDMVFVEGGSFKIGCDGEDSYEDAKPSRLIEVDSFYMSKYEISYEIYDLFWDKWYNHDDSGFGKGKHPAINVSWYDTIAFCNWLSIKEGLTPCYFINGSEVVWRESANGYRLPTEAEWEYAARGGKFRENYIYSGSNQLDYVGWYGGESMSYNGNSDLRPQKVGLKPPNSLEIYDMTGNVYEWCWDWYDKEAYKTLSQNNPKGPISGKDKVIRGGCWGNHANYLRVFDRFTSHPSTRSSRIGFRVVRSSINSSDHK